MPRPPQPGDLGERKLINFLSTLKNKSWPSNFGEKFKFESVSIFSFVADEKFLRCCNFLRTTHSLYFHVAQFCACSAYNKLASSQPAQLFGMGHSRPLFLYFRLFWIAIDRNISLPMSGFKSRISGGGSDRSANCAATTALNNPPS